MINSSLLTESKKTENFDDWNKEFREGWTNVSFNSSLPKGSKITDVIVSGGQVTEIIYTTPNGEIINIKMNLSSFY